MSQILPDQRAEMLARIAALEAENAKLKARNTPGVSFKVTEPKLKEDGTMSQGGAISVYGLGRFPVTLYWGQWERLLAKANDLVAFAKANQAKLSVKE